ncbi:unnamed protein product [Vitrella brassicaformis CCMP3155]|uniref:Coatomer subunit delta n=1 Tax=Vitrella brassicaformis (strain CCMP3155) TaxID=1169540 RepID=A0A0G4F3W3_VITBC|nr:unnamed protein product [Vitrella brassicaformis CCMP3155]|mmetsp:Transcript_10724/g.25993  ORF Transcript_10724/g.25993 Transcript_10724/m.25993 type:complete len:520 (-) Transcript_10724:548-2107(-)|eukprot:CEM06693.1 unnamed protein product [Vitrella brassicaformis CCMP3155]
MVVLSAAILTKAKTLVARQFVEMTRLRVEGLLSAFPKLIEIGSKDHTYIETESVRYVYQPIESLYLLLITNKASNILEDLETLRLLAKIVQDCCQITVTEELVVKHAFDIVFAFDEVISFGYRESVTLSQIKTYTEMDSHEERLHQMIEQSKINEAKEVAKRKQLELAKQRALQKQADKANPAGSGISLEDELHMNPSAQHMMDKEPTPWGAPHTAPGANEMDSTAMRAGLPKKGMQIGKKKPAAELLDSLRPTPSAVAASAASTGLEEDNGRGAAPVNPLLEPVTINIEEKIQAQLHAEGGLNDMDIQGQFEATVLDVNKADLAAFKVSPEDKRFKWKVHPNLNKSSHANSILEFRDASRCFRQNTPMPLLKWRLQTKSEELLPMSVSCWMSSTSDGTVATIEFELTKTDLALQDLRFSIPCPPNSHPTVSSADVGEYSTEGNVVAWTVPLVDSNAPTGTMEFSAKTDSSSLLPFQIDATSQTTVCNIEVLECYHMEKKEPIAFALNRMAIYTFTVDQ